MEDDFLITVRKNDSMVLLDIKGKIIGSWGQELGEKLEELQQMGEERVTLNFQEVDSIDSSGVMAISDRIKAGQQIKILHPNPNCKEFLQHHELTYLVEGGAVFHPLSPPAERRRHKRIDTNFPIEIEYRNNRLRGVLLNISEGGALLGYLDPLEATAEGEHRETPHLAEPLRISLELRFLGTIELPGKPVSFRQNSEMHTLGIQLLHSNDRSRHLLQKMVDDPSTFLPPTN